MWPLQVPTAPLLEHARQLLAQQARALKAEYGDLEKDMSITMAPAPDRRPRQVLTPDSLARLLVCLRVLPHGVVKYSHAVPGEYWGFGRLP